MKKLLPILFLCIVSCNQKESIDKDKFILSIKNYYMLQTKDVKSVDEVSIDSIVPVTEKKQLEDSLQVKEKKYYFFIEAKDDEYADSAAKDMERIQQRLRKAESTIPVYYTVYHTVRFTANDMTKRKRESNFNITSDYQIRPNAVTDRDKTEGIKAEPLYKPYKY